MSFPRPAFMDLINSALADLARLPGADITLRRSLLQVLAYMAAAMASGEYDYIDWAVVNVLLPDTATGGYLDRWANIVGLQRLAPTSAVGNVIFTGTATTPIPAGTQVQTSNSGVVLTTNAAAVIGAGCTVSVAATAAPGSIGNLVAGTPVTLLVAIAGVLANAVMDGGGSTGGADAETDTLLRVRVLARLSNPPQGGSNFDYVTWAKLVSGVTRVWVYGSQFGAGTVGVAFVMDGRANIFPLSADIANVQAELTLLCPVTATPTAYAPTLSTIAVNIHGLTVLSGYTLANVQANIVAALAALNTTITPGGYGWDGQAEAFLTGGHLDLNLIYGAIDNAAGVNTFDLTAPAADQIAGSCVMLQLGAPTWV